MGKPFKGLHVARESSLRVRLLEGMSSTTLDPVEYRGDIEDPIRGGPPSRYYRVDSEPAWHAAAVACWSW
jgi:hypothetical protein